MQVVRPNADAVLCLITLLQQRQTWLINMVVVAAGYILLAVYAAVLYKSRFCSVQTRFERSPISKQIFGEQSQRADLSCCSLLKCTNFAYLMV